VIRSFRKWALPFFLILYVLSGVVLMLAEARLTFSGWTFPKPWQEPSPDTAPEEVSVQSSAGDTITGWWLSPMGWTPAQGAVLYLHGNAENVSTSARTLLRLRDELHSAVLGFDYPGYGRSSGQPEEQTCQAAAQASFSWLLEKGVPAERITVVGQSLGAAIALELVRQNPCRLLVTSGAFTTFPDIAQHRYFWLPARYLVRQRFNNVSAIGQLQTPVFIVHGKADHVVPFSHGEQLYAMARPPKRLYGIAKHHHSFPKQPEFYATVRAFLQETETAALPAPR